MFTDLVGSTVSSGQAGDDAWRETLAGHDRVCRAVIEDCAGVWVKSTGDGVLAHFPTPSGAIDAAGRMADALGGLGLQIRTGVHTGELEVLDDGDITGFAVNLAARIEQAAGAGEVLVSSTVRDLLLGGSTSFIERGEHELKGIDGCWKLFALDR